MLSEVTEAEATDAARKLASVGGQRYGTRPGELLDVIFAERLKSQKPRERVIVRATNAQVEHAAAVSAENPQWVFADGRESPYHYIVRLAVLSALVPQGDAILGGGSYSCGVQGCVDCSRMPLPPQQKPAARSEEIPF